MSKIPKPEKNPNKLYYVLNDWNKDNKLRLLVAFGIIKDYILEWLEYYNYYLKLTGRTKNDNILDTSIYFNVSERTIWKAIQLFERPIEEQVIGFKTEIIETL